MYFSLDALEFFGGDIAVKKVYPKTHYKNLENLPKIPYYEKLIEPTYMETFRQHNNRSIILPPKIKLLLDEDPRLKYKSKAERLPRLYPELERYNIFVHIGQRKLFLSEIQHLTEKLTQREEYAIVVYAGAAPSNKAWIEHLLFPNVKFLFVDPNMFSIYIESHRDHHYNYPEIGIAYWINSTDNYNPAYEVPKCTIRYMDKIIEDKYASDAPTDTHLGDEHIKHFFESDNSIFICESLFTNEIAAFCHKLFAARHNYPKFEDCKVLFWCDIRTNDKTDENDAPSDLDILWNSAMMYNWCRIMEPDHAMLKFRCPYLNTPKINFDAHKEDFELCAKYGNDIEANIAKGDFTYFKGEIYHQVWHGRISTETRLWIDKEDIVSQNIMPYNCVAYEETLFYYNALRRTSMLHANRHAEPNLGFDHCGDCALEAHIWNRYYVKMNQTIDVKFWVSFLSDLTARSLKRAGHGYLIPPSKQQNRQQFYALIGGKPNQYNYYLKFVDEKYRKLIDASDDMSAPKIEYDLASDPKLRIKLSTLFADVEDPDTLKMLNEMNNNRMNFFNTRRSTIAELWHLASILKGDEHALVVYFGSAKGTTLHLLHKLFPNVKFLLIDPSLHYININNADDYHYNYYTNPDNYITYLSLNNRDFMKYYDPERVVKFSIKYFDGDDEIHIANKYKYLDSLPLNQDTISRYYDYIFESKNKFFILEQLFDDDLAEALALLKAEMKNYADFKNAKMIFWSDAIFPRDRSRNATSLYYEMNAKGWALFYIWLKKLQPDYAMMLFRPIVSRQLSKDTVIKDVMNAARSLGNDMLDALNSQGKLQFFDGKLTVVPYMNVNSNYALLWIDGQSISKNVLRQYSFDEFNDVVAYHTVIERFTILRENQYASKYLGFDHCNDCAVEACAWHLYKTNINSEINVQTAISWLNKLTGHALLDHVHGYMFPKTAEIEIKLFLEQHIKGLVPEIYHKYIVNVDKPRLPKMILTEDDAKFDETLKLSDSKYNQFVNIPARKYLISGLQNIFLYSLNRAEYGTILLVYCGCHDDPTIWQLVTIIKRLKVLCFTRELMNIFIERHGYTHWQDYENPDNLIAYLSVNKQNTPEDDLDIRPIKYFNGKEAIRMLDKNNEEEYATISSLSDIAPEQYENYANFIFTSSHKIFVFEEDLTPATCDILKSILDHRYTYPVANVNAHDSPNLSKHMMWFTNSDLSYGRMVAKGLGLNFVRYIYNDSTCKLDSDEFYLGGFNYLPWSNRQRVEFEIASVVDDHKLKKINFDNIFRAVQYHNILTRVQLHINAMKDETTGYDCCWDCAVESRILTTIKNEGTSSLRAISANAALSNIYVLLNYIANITNTETLKKNGHGVLFI